MSVVIKWWHLVAAVCSCVWILLAYSCGVKQAGLNLCHEKPDPTPPELDLAPVSVHLPNQMPLICAMTCMHISQKIIYIVNKLCNSKRKKMHRTGRLKNIFMHRLLCTLVAFCCQLTFCAQSQLICRGIIMKGLWSAMRSALFAVQAAWFQWEWCLNSFVVTHFHTFLSLSWIDLILVLSSKERDGWINKENEFSMLYTIFRSTFMSVCD